MDVLFEIGKLAVTLVITLVIICGHRHLSTRKNWLLGSIFPLVTVATLGVIFAVMYEKLILVLPNYLLGCGILLVLEILIWADGRRQCRKNELNKMKAQDIE